MNLSELRHTIRVKLKNGESYGNIGLSLGISKAMVRYIETHDKYKPSKKMIKILNLDPSPSQLYTLTRNQKLDKIARSRGYACWSAYESAMIREMEACQLIS